MRLRPRVTLGTVAYALALIGVNLALMRAAYATKQMWPLTWIAFIVAPPTTLVIVALGMCLFDLWKLRESRPFPFGYVIFGSIATIIGGWLFDTDTRLNPYLDFTMGWAEKSLHSLFPFPWIEGVLIGLATLAVALPQVLPAVFGGLLTSYFGITLLVRARRRDVEIAIVVRGRRRDQRPNLPGSGADVIT